MRRCVSTLPVLIVLVPAACAGGQRASTVAAPPRPGVIAPPGSTSTPTLDGAALLERTCTKCHDLRGLNAYADYWGEAEWRSMVETMIGYGAELRAEEIPVLVRYLAVNYGTAGEEAKGVR